MLEREVGFTIMEEFELPYELSVLVSKKRFTEVIQKLGKIFSLHSWAISMHISYEFCSQWRGNEVFWSKHLCGSSSSTDTEEH